LETIAPTIAGAVERGEKSLLAQCFKYFFR
jgi:hypothetical protein